MAASNNFAAHYSTDPTIRFFATPALLIGTTQAWGHDRRLAVHPPMLEAPPIADELLTDGSLPLSFERAQARWRGQQRASNGI